MMYYTKEGLPLYYEMCGNGPPLLLIAGLASDSRSWQPVRDGLAERFTLIMPDNRGVGRSSQECVTSIDLIADDCFALIQHLGMENVNLLGHSMGGMVAMSYAVRYPSALNKLIVVSSAPQNSARNNQLFSDWATSSSAGQDRFAWFRSIFYWIFTAHFFNNLQMVNEAVRWLVEDAWPQSSQAFRRQVEAIAAWDATVDLCRISSPTCIITGNKDILFPMEDSLQLTELIPGACLTVIEHAAHSIHTEQPDAFINAIGNFIV